MTEKGNLCLFWSCYSPMLEHDTIGRWDVGKVTRMSGPTVKEVDIQPFLANAIRVELHALPVRLILTTDHIAGIDPALKALHDMAQSDWSAYHTLCYSEHQTRLFQAVCVAQWCYGWVQANGAKLFREPKLRNKQAALRRKQAREWLDRSGLNPR